MDIPWDNELAVEDFLAHANVVSEDEYSSTVYVSVVYANLDNGEILYRSLEPLEVRLSSLDMTIMIPDLPVSCVSKFSIDDLKMCYSFGMLVIYGDTPPKGKAPFAVTMI